MTATSASGSTTAPAVVPRWEWRTFGDDLLSKNELAFLTTLPAVASEETYVLSMAGDASVKVRDGVLDTKVLHRVSSDGLQLWIPTMKAPFPLEEPDLVTAFAALGASLPAARAERPGLEEFLHELVGGRDDLRAVQTRKRRRRTVLDECMIELTDITVGDRTTWSVAAESPDPDLVARTVERLGLAGAPNTCVAAGLKSLIEWLPTRFAVVDIGTNSVKYVLGERHGARELVTIREKAVVTRLGEGLTGSGRLAPEAIARTVDAVEEMVRDARREQPAAVVAVGTAGLRQAANSEEFRDALHERCGMAVQVISGAEEARLAYVAAVSALPLVGDQLLVFDSGGGSTQFTIGTVTSIEEQFSLDIGAVAVTERFGLADAVPREAVESALEALAETFDRVRHAPRPDMLIAIGGTSTNLAAHQHELASYDPDVVHGTVLDLDDVDRQIETFRQLSADGRRELPGLQPARAEVILAGACIVRTILTITGQHQLVVSDRGLRHGVAAERFGPGSTLIADATES